MQKWGVQPFFLRLVYQIDLMLYIMKETDGLYYGSTMTSMISIICAKMVVLPFCWDWCMGLT